MEINVMELELGEKDEFSRRFNYVGKLYKKATDEALSLEEKKAWEEEYFNAKYCLEQGLPISFIIDLSQKHPSLT